MKKALIVAMGALYVMLLAGCNTVQGMGKDLRDAGSAIQQAASK